MFDALTSAVDAAAQIQTRSSPSGTFSAFAAHRQASSAKELDNLRGFRRFLTAKPYHVRGPRRCSPPNQRINCQVPFSVGPYGLRPNFSFSSLHPRLAPQEPSGPLD